MMDRVLGEGVRRLKGRYPVGTASRAVGDGAFEATLVDAPGFDDERGIGVGVRLSPGNLPKLSIS